MAAYMRPGDRVFFVYDHSVVTKEEDDPQDAIVYFAPQTTSIDVQFTFSGQLMGMVNVTKTIADSPPKLYKLRKNKIATMHEGQFTLALACKVRTPDSAIVRKLENLYKVFSFYHCSITRVRQASSSREAFLSNMCAIWDFYVPYVRRYGNAVPAIFEPIQSVQFIKGGNYLFLRCSHLLQWLKSQPSLLAGCILYRRSVLCTQLTPELTSHLLVIKPNQLHHPSKSIADTLPFGVRIMSVYITKEQYKQISSRQKTNLRPRHAPLRRTDDTTSSQTSPAENDDKTYTASMGKPRVTQRRISSTSGQLFPSFSRILEGSVVDSSQKSGTRGKLSVSESSEVDEKMVGVNDEENTAEVTLSRNSLDAVNLQGKDDSLSQYSRPSLHGDDISKVQPSNSVIINNHRFSRTPQVEDLIKFSPPKKTQLLTENPEKSQSSPVELKKSLPNGAIPTNKNPSGLSNAAKVVLKMEEKTTEKRTLTEMCNTGQSIADERSQSKDVTGSGSHGNKVAQIMFTNDELNELHHGLGSETKSESPESGIADCTDPRLDQDFADNKDEECAIAVQEESHLKSCRSRGRENVLKRHSSTSGTQPTTVLHTREKMPTVETNTNDSRTSVHPCQGISTETESFDSNRCRLIHSASLDSDDTLVDCNNTNHLYLDQQSLDVTGSRVALLGSLEVEDAVDDSSASSQPAQMNGGLTSNGNGQIKTKTCSVMRTINSPPSAVERKEDTDSTAGGSVLEGGSEIEKSTSDFDSSFGRKPLNNDEDNRDIINERDFISPVGDKVIIVDGPDEEHQEDVTKTSEELEEFKKLPSLCRGEDGVKNIVEDKTDEELIGEDPRILGCTEDEHEEGIAEMNKHMSDPPIEKMKDSRTTSTEMIEKERHVAADCPVVEEAADGKPKTNEGTAKDEARTLEKISTDNEDEVAQDMVNVSLYVQAHSDTTLLFLAEKSISNEKETLFQLWRKVLGELGELELHLKDAVKSDLNMESQTAYNFISFDRESRSLEGNIANPVNLVESFFCRCCQITHEQLRNDETLTDITLRNHQTVVYAHQNPCHHTFFQKTYFKSTPTSGIPFKDDHEFYVQQSCKEALRERNIKLF